MEAEKSHDLPSLGMLEAGSVVPAHNLDLRTREADSVSPI